MSEQEAGAEEIIKRYHAAYERERKRVKELEAELSRLKSSPSPEAGAETEQLRDMVLAQRLEIARLSASPTPDAERFKDKGHQLYCSQAESDRGDWPCDCILSALPPQDTKEEKPNG